MKCVALLATLVAMVVAESFYYETANDYIDVDAIIADPPLLQTYVDCYLDKGPCSYVAESYKRHIADSVIRACDRCNSPQRERYAKLLWGMRTYLPQDYLNFRQKYDPSGSYFDRLEAVLAPYLHFKTPVPQPYFYYLSKK